jgi:large subunit ribosomal protein L25
MKGKIQVNIKNREPYSSNSTRRLRREGLIPAVVYGPGENFNGCLEKNEFIKTFSKVGEHTIITLNFEDGEDRQVLIKDYQIHPRTKQLSHIDFLIVSEDRPIKTHIPIKIVGNPKGAKMGGILEQFVSNVMVKTLPKDLPHFFELDVSDLGILDSLKVRDIDVPDGVTILNPPTQTIVGVVTSRVAKEAEATTETEEEGEGEGEGEEKTEATE